MRPVPKPMINGRLLFGLILVALLAAGALAAGLPGFADPIKQDYDAMSAPPGPQHLLGTDQLGRDVLSRILHGARVSLLVAVAAVAATVAIGVPAGAVAGYFGGRLDTLIMRTADAFLAVPFVLGAIALMAAFGPGALNVFLTLMLLGWPSIARVTRAQVLDEASKDYVAAVKVVGGSPWYILRRHLLPNVAGPIVVFAFTGVATAILTEATLSFLGLGIQAPVPAWGTMLAEALGRFATEPWLLFGPGAAVVMACLGFNLLGEGLRDALEIDG